jgi:hypothetical protein
MQQIIILGDYLHYPKEPTCIEIISEALTLLQSPATATKPSASRLTRKPPFVFLRKRERMEP